MENLTIIPFGKYKGQPIEALRADQKYTEWLMQQDWFKEKYTTFQTLIVNNFNAPQDSPEHNKIANLFLNDHFCINLFKFCGSHVTNNHKIPYVIHKSNEYEIQCKVNSIVDNGYKVKTEFELKEGSDVLVKIIKSYTVHYDIKNQYNNLQNEVSYNNARFKFYESCRGIKKMVNITIETNKKHTEYSHATIEIKPIVGDDYPTVIRQCRAQKSKILLIGQFKSSVITIEDLRKMFSDIRIVLLTDVNC